MSIDFQSLKQSINANLESLLAELFPAGKRQGREFCIGDVSGSAGSSLKFNLDKGVGSDFASGFSGDFIDLWAEHHGIGLDEAARQIGERLSLGDLTLKAPEGKFQSKQPSRGCTKIPMREVPDWAPPPPEAHPYHGNPSKVWSYTNEQGEPISYVYRFEKKDRKEVIPLCWCRYEGGGEGWEWRAPAEPRMLYNLHEVYDRPNAKIVVVEGEKAADAAKLLLPSAVVVTWSGGTNAIAKTDWSPIEDRVVVIWPDEDHKVYKEGDIVAKGHKIGDEKVKEDQPGYKAAIRIKERIPHARIFQTSGTHKDGWDAADALAEGATVKQAEDFLGVHEAEEAQGYIPTNRQMESALLHGILHADAMERLLAEGANEDWFTEKNHQMIFSAALRAYKQHGDVDASVVKSEMELMVRAGEWSGDPIALVDSIKSEGRKYQSYLEKVKSDYILRKVQMMGARFHLTASRPFEPVEIILRDLNKIVNEFHSISMSNAEETAKDRAKKLLDQKIAEMRGEVPSVPDSDRVHVGMPKLEDAFKPISRADLDNFILVGAPTSTGKSALMRQIICENFDKHEDWVCVGFLLESALGDFLHNSACAHVGIDTRDDLHLLVGHKQKAYVEYFKKMTEALDERLFLLDSSASVEDIRSKCTEIRAKCGRIDLVIVDYLQIAERERRGNPESEVAGISRSLKQLQKFLKCPLFAGTQLNEDGRSRESRAIENDSTRFWVIDRPEKSKDGSPQGDGFLCHEYYQTIHQKKFRNGPRIRVDTMFQVKFQRMTDW